MQTLALYPDDSPHLVSLYVTNLGTDRLTRAEWTTVALAPVATVEVLIEWWKDLLWGEVLRSYEALEAAASKSLKTGAKGKATGTGKVPPLHTRLSDSLIANVKSQMSHMIGSG